MSKEQNGNAPVERRVMQDIQPSNVNFKLVDVLNDLDALADLYQPVYGSGWGYNETL